MLFLNSVNHHSTGNSIVSCAKLSIFSYTFQDIIKLLNACKSGWDSVLLEWIVTFLYKNEIPTRKNELIDIRPFREHADDFINGPPQSSYKKVVKCFRKKVVDRERLAKMILEREISLQLGAFDDMKSATWSPSTYSGIKVNNSSKFNISAKSAKSSNIPQR